MANVCALYNYVSICHSYISLLDPLDNDKDLTKLDDAKQDEEIATLPNHDNDAQGKPTTSLFYKVYCSLNPLGLSHIAINISHIKPCIKGCHCAGDNQP